MRIISGIISWLSLLQKHQGFTENGHKKSIAIFSMNGFHFRFMPRHQNQLGLHHGLAGDNGSQLLIILFAFRGPVPARNEVK